MATGKRDISDKSIIALLLGGTSASQLQKKTKTTQRDIARALLSNPEAFAALQGSSIREGRKFETYDPSRFYYEPQVEQSIVNPITDKWRALAASDPNAAFLAQEYFKSVVEKGNDPGQLKNIRDKAEKIGVNILGMKKEDANSLLGLMEEDRDKFFTEELNRRRRLEEENYKAFSRGRADLKLEEGQGAQEAIFEKATGLGELQNVPSPKYTFQRQAQELAAKQFIPQAKGIGVDAAERVALKQAGNLAAYEKAFMGELKKRGKEKSSPFKEAVKKLLPSVLAKKELGL